MASYSDKIAWWADWRCNPLEMVAVAFPGSDRDWNLPVADAAAPAFETFAGLMRKHDYLFREVSGGTYNCRKIAGSDKWSLHAYGIAIDLNPSKNPYGTHTHNFPQGFVDDVLATGLFKWGIDFDDPMHWEIDVPPEEIDMPMTKDEILAELGITAADLGRLKQLSVAAQAERPVTIEGAMTRLLQYEKAGDFPGSGAAGDHNHDGRYLKGVEGKK